MPKGPRGEKRPADVIGAAVLVGKIATGETEEKLGGLVTSDKQTKGGQSRMSAMSKADKGAMSRQAAKVRWSGGAAASGKKEPQEHQD